MLDGAGRGGDDRGYREVGALAMAQKHTSSHVKSHTSSRAKTPISPRRAIKRLLAWVGWPVWMAVSFIAAGVICALPLGESSTAVVILLYQAAVYVVLLLLLIGGPWLVGVVVPRYVSALRTTWRQLGLQRLLRWKDIAWALVGVVLYILLSMVLLFIAQHVVPGFDVSQRQDIGVSQQLFGMERFIAFIAFVLAAPIAEEVAFRGYLYGKLRHARMPVWAVVLVVSVLFGLAHGQWNVGVDVFALSLVMCGLRCMTDTIWPAMVLHIIKNTVAFIGIFVLMV